MTAAVSVKEAVERASQQLDRRPLLVCTDFDGTLSTIVMDPWAAAILPLARTALRRLAGMPGVSVVVLSGRTAWDVAARVRVGNVTYLGNHGMERGYLARGGRPEKLRCQWWVRRMQKRRWRRAWPTKWRRESTSRG